jgi:hypothetical protein
MRCFRARAREPPGWTDMKPGPDGVTPTVMRLDPGIVGRRCRTLSLGCGHESNAAFSESGPHLHRRASVRAIVDRLTFQAHIIETGSESHRLKSTRQKRQKAATANVHAAVHSRPARQHRSMSAPWP